MRNDKKALAGLAALAVLTLIGGTWAYYSQTLQAGNEFMTAKYDTTLEEKFQSPEDWQPGLETEKRVWVNNNGNVPVLAKIAVDQKWVRREDVLALTSADADAKPEPVKPYKGESFPLTFQGSKGTEFAAIIHLNQEAVVALNSGRANDENLRLDIPSVQSMEEARGKWLLVDETPNDLGRYLFYYVGIVEPGKSTPELIESVTMNPELENTILGTRTYFVKEADGYRKITVDNVNSAYGYDSSTYTLNVVSTTVQATQAAVNTVFGADNKDYETVKYLADYVAETGVYTSDTAKKLYFDERSGTMTYTPYRMADGSEDGNWFMSFTNMVPGGKYQDKLVIENESRKNYYLYMQIVPRSQDELKDELLEKITMKVYQKDQLIYDGKATGAQYGEGNDFQKVIYMGYYPKRSGSDEIHVELELDSSLELDPVTGMGRYDDILTKIDWKFMVSEASSGGGGDNPPTNTTVITGEVPLSPVPNLPIDETVTIPDQDVPLETMVPKTGDEQPVTAAVFLTLLSGMGFLFLLGKIRRDRRKS